MQLYRSLCRPILGPVKKTYAKFYQRGIEAEQFVPEAKLLSYPHPLTLPGQLIEDLLIQLPRPVLIGIRKR